MFLEITIKLKKLNSIHLAKLSHILKLICSKIKRYHSINNIGKIKILKNAFTK